MVNDFIPNNQFIPLPEKIPGEYERHVRELTLLSSLWKERAPARAQECSKLYSADLEHWKQQLNPELVGTYLAGLGARIRGILLNNSSFKTLAEGVLLCPEQAPMSLDVFVSGVLKETERCNESSLIHAVQIYSGDSFENAAIGLQYIGDSFCRREISKLPALKLFYEEQDKVKIALEL